MQSCISLRSNVYSIIIWLNTSWNDHYIKFSEQPSFHMDTKLNRKKMLSVAITVSEREITVSESERKRECVCVCVCVGPQPKFHFVFNWSIVDLQC